MNKEEAYDFSTSLVQLAADMSAATGIPVAQVLENLQSIMTGGAQAGYKYGLVIKDTAVKLKALQMGLVQTEVDMTDVNAASLKLEKSAEEFSNGVSEARRRVVRIPKRASEGRGGRGGGRKDVRRERDCAGRGGKGAGTVRVGHGAVGDDARAGGAGVGQLQFSAGADAHEF